MAGENINRRINIYINDREVSNSQRAIGREMKKVLAEIRNLNKGSEDYQKQLDRLTDTYKRLQREHQGFNVDLKETPGILGRIQNALGPVGSGMLAAFSVSGIVSGVVSKIREAANMVVEFDQKQALLAATMQKTRTQIMGLTLDAIKIGASTAYSASEVSDLQAELARLGKTAPEIKAMTSSVLNSATALETGLGEAAVLVGGQLNSYGESADQAAKFSDIMANSVNISATSYDYLSTSLPKVSAVAAQAGVSFEKLNGIMGVLADQNLAAETAGTGFRNILLQSAKAGKPYQEMLDKVKNSTNQTKTATELFGKENATVAVILANSTNKIIENTRALENSMGSAEKLAKEKMNSIKGAQEEFSGAWEGFVLSIEKGDGRISKMIRSMYEWGASLLNLVTPMKRVSDGIQDEQLGLNMLVSKITSTNIKNEERKQLLLELQREYPEFIENIDIETVSNEELTSALAKVNEQYAKRIVLQKQAEKVEDAAKSEADWISERLAWQEKLFKKLNETKIKYKLDVPIDFGNIEESAKKVVEELRKQGEGTGNFFGRVFAGLRGDVGAIESFLSQMEAMDRAAKDANKEVGKQTEVLERYKKQLGLATEAERDAAKAAKARAEELKKLRQEALEKGMKDAMTASEKEVRLWLQAYKERMAASGELSEEERKKRERELEEQRRHTEKLKKDLETSEKELLETRRTFQDLNLGLLKDGFDKELKILNEEYNRKIEDVRIRIKQEEDAIKRLEQELKNPKNTSEDLALLKKQIDAKVAIQKVYNETLVSLEKTRTVKIAALQEKYLKESYKREEEEFNRELRRLQTKHEMELAAITTLDEAKAILQNYLSAEELKKVRTLEAAKKRVKEEFLKEEFELQKRHLEQMIARSKELLMLNATTGLEIITEEQRKEILKFLDDAAAKLAKLQNSKKSDDENKDKDGLKSLSGIDILGFTPEQWQDAFDSLDTFAEKIGAIEIITGAMQSAWGKFFSFLEAGEQRSLQKFQRNVDRKKKELATQLEKGYITQEVYNARVEKLEADMEKKQAELEYRKAKREKVQSALSIVTNTGIGVMKAVAASPLTGGMPWSAIIAGMGAVQLAGVLAQPLPPKNGFKDGGYTGDGDPNQSPGPVHYEEYVVPQKVLFSGDPVVPDIIGYLEAKRQNRAASFERPSVPVLPVAQASQERSAMDGAMILTLERVAAILDRVERNGVVALLSNDMKTAKRLNDKIKELEKLKTEARP